MIYRNKVPLAEMEKDNVFALEQDGSRRFRELLYINIKDREIFAVIEL